MTDGIQRVLVATDGSEHAERAARHGIALAAATGAELHAISVVERAAREIVRSILGDSDPAEGMAAEATQAVDQVAALADDEPRGASVTTEVRRGRPHDAILDYAEEVGADVVVAGTEGRSGLDRVLLGSTAENLLRTATVQVLVVPPGAAEPADEGAPYRELLFPTDGSDGADRALDWALWLAWRFDAPLYALFAADAEAYPTTVRSQELLDALQSAGNDAIKAARERGEEAGVDVEGAVGSGAPGSTILEFCEDEPVDLVVMGTHGRSGIERAILGSVTEHVVRHGDVPVFAVPPAAE